MAVSALLSTVLLALPQLSQSELQVVRTRCGASVSLTQAAPDGGNTGVVGDYLLEGICQELRRRGALASGKRLPARVIPPSYVEASSTVRSYFEKYMGALSPAELAALGQLMGEALATYLEKRGIPVAPQTLLNNVAKVPAAVDDAFPDYLQNGMLAYTWRGVGSARG